MKTKRLFHKFTAWLLTFAMLMTFVPGFTFSVNATTANEEIKANFEEESAETNVASVTINGVTTEYATLKEAFTAASNKNATITLLRDYDAAYENSQPYITGNTTVTTFDLGGHTLSYTNLVPGVYTSRNPAFAGICTIKNGTIEADNRYFALSAYSAYSCTMTIKGDVSINTTNEYGNAVGVTGKTTLIIESGASITSNNDDRYTGGAICVYNGGKVIINGGSIVNNGSAPAISTYNNGNGSTVVVNGGSVSDMKVSDAYFNVDNDATVTGNAWYKLTNSIPTDKATVAYDANTTLYEGVIYGLGGAEVSLSVTPASSVTISKILANDTEATLSEGVYSFDMPNELVTLTAETQTAATPTTYTVTVTDDGNGTASADVESGEEGTEVVLTVTPNDGYKFREWEVISGGVTVTDDKFTIGTADVEIKAVFEEDTTETYVASVTVGTTTTNYADIGSAITAAMAEDDAILKLLDDVNTDTDTRIDSGSFTIDINGKTWESTHYVMSIREDANVKIIDSVGTGKLLGTGGGSPTILLCGDACLEITGGTIEHAGNTAVIYMVLNSQVTNAQLTMSGGKIKANNSAPGIETKGKSVTITGGTIEGTRYDIQYRNGIIDLSGHSDPTGITIRNSYGAEVAIGENTIKLPDGYVMLDEEDNVADTLANATAYTVGEEPGPVVTSIDFNRESPAYDEESNTFYVSDSFPFELEIIGENLTKLSNAGGLDALFEREKNSEGSAKVGVSIQSDTYAKVTVDEFAMYQFILAFCTSTKTTSIMLKNDITNTQYGPTVYVNLMNAPTFNLEIADAVGGMVTDNHNGLSFAEGAEVILDIAPNAGYELESLIVDNVDVTDSVVNNKYTFTMPAKNVDVEATFKTTIEAFWGPDADNLTNSGTFAEFQHAFITDSTARYVKINKEFTVNNTMYITRELIFDLAGHNITFLDRAFTCNSGGELTITDSAATDGIMTFNYSGGSIFVLGGVLNIRGGKFITYNDDILIQVHNGSVTISDGEISVKNTAVRVASGTLNITGGVITSASESESYSVIESSDTLNISGGTILSENYEAIWPFGHTTITDNAIINGADCDIRYRSNLLDLSGWENANGKKIYCDAFNVSTDSILRLPQGLYLLDSNGIIVDTMQYGNIYVIDDNPKFTVTFVDWQGNTIDTQTVNLGSYATAPEIPQRPGWKFVGWDTAFDNVTSNLTVTAQYAEKTVVPIPDIGIKHYNGSLQTATVPDSEFYIVKENNGGTDAGRYDVVLELTDSENYTWEVTSDKTVTLPFYIDRILNQWTTEPSINDWTYGDIPSTPVGEVTFGTMIVEYKGAAEDDAAYTTTVPVNAGDYKVRFRVDTTTNYLGNAHVVDLTINKLPVNITWDNADGLVYDGTEKSIIATVSNKVDGDSVNLTITGTTSATEKGTYTATVTEVDNDNYTVTNGTNLTKEWAISETYNEWITPLSITGWTFGDSASIPFATAKFGTVEYTYSDIIDGAYTNTVPVNAGTYYVKATVLGTTSYAEISDTEQFVIEAKELNANNISAIADKIYSGEEIKPSLEVKDGNTLLTEGTDYDVVYQDNINTGIAKALVTFKGNYRGTGEKEFNILKKLIDSAIPLTAPVKNELPQTDITGDGYTATVVWSPSVAGRFDYNTQYTATVTITVDTNHTVTGIAENGYTVSGATTVTNTADSNVATVTYDATGSRPSSGGGGSSRYTVKFESNGGDAVASKTVTRNNKVTEPEAPERKGYTFAGWYTDKELLTLYDFTDKVTKSFTLYAKWTENEKQDDTENKDDNKEENDQNNTQGAGHTCHSLKFDDLDITKWYHSDTDYVIGNDIFKGTTETTFAPDGNITRAMMITVLYRAEGEPEVSGNTTFEDVSQDAYYHKAVSWGQKNGIINGYSDTEYAPEQPILREQIAAIIFRYSIYKGMGAVTLEENLHFDDAHEISEYAISAFNWAVGTGMIKGRTETTLNPKDYATRAEIAAILHRYLENK